MNQGDQDTLVVGDTNLAYDNPVPGDSESCLYGSGVFNPHLTEEQVSRNLLALPNVEFDSLHVHRLKDGICLTGVVHLPEGTLLRHVERAAAKAAGTSKVLNRLVVQKKSAAMLNQ